VTRDTLRKFIQGLVVAALPLTGGSCDQCTERRQTDNFQAYVPVPDGGLADAPVPTKAFCDNACQTTNFGCTVDDVLDSDMGLVAITCKDDYMDCPMPGYTGGRRPAGLRRPRRFGRVDVVGAHFARMAHMEAASVEAFRRLGRELVAHGAPAHLIGAARAAVDDERRHARMVGRLARRRGVTPPPVEIAAQPLRSLEAIALENAVEGCVMETWGAVEATWQARAAHDPLVRAVMGRLSSDETRHAELAFAVARWAEPRLDGRARARVRAARKRALERLARRIARQPPPALIALAGLPPRGAARQMAAQLGALF
jgi:hypothetical protein